MKTRWLLFALPLAVGVACSLNPQPYPPDQPDGSITGGLDAGSDASNAFGDSGAGADAAPPPETDAATADADADADASDAETDAGDAETDASDAEADAPDDATGDAAND